MNKYRPKIPADIKRVVLIEAGHRCAIPTCRQTTTEIAHIEPWERVKKHEPDNLIALCPNCHTRFDKGEIDKKSTEIYKRKLIFLSDRYSKYELTVLFELSKKDRIFIGGGKLLVIGLLDDELIKITEITCWMGEDGELDPIEFYVSLTEKGKSFIKGWKSKHETKWQY